ncbi:MAG: diadenylate cyclase CdaA [Acidobacteriota bacterium]|nr:diadenylate cyclase CdaA [Blastocatellia bacterium]MDW8413390.1 diadenylate cyclase CdaA [Acidobacteriota bacterium]
MAGFELGIREIVDISIVTLLAITIVRQLRDTPAIQAVIAVLFFVFLYIVSSLFQLRVLLFVVEHTYLYLGFAIIIVFQREIRRALLYFGSIPYLKGILGARSELPESELINAIVLATNTMSSSKTGALLVIERQVGLQEHIEQGIFMDAIASYDLIITIFQPQTPLHDGAVIIRKRRIAAAGCFLPLSINPKHARELGTRHRAAIGISEETDAIAIVVSEETGIISVVEKGEVYRHMNSEKLRSYLQKALSE